MSSSGKACQLCCCLGYCDLSTDEHEEQFVMDGAKYTKNTQNDDTCVVCLESFDTEVTVKLACKHKFHKDCIVRWVTQNTTCPLCKKDILKTTLRKCEYTFKMVRPISPTFSTPIPDSASGVSWDAAYTGMSPFYM